MHHGSYLDLLSTWHWRRREENKDYRFCGRRCSPIGNSQRRFSSQEEESLSSPAWEIGEDGGIVARNPSHHGPSVFAVRPGPSRAWRWRRGARGTSVVEPHACKRTCNYITYRANRSFHDSKLRGWGGKWPGWNFIGTRNCLFQGFFCLPSDVRTHAQFFLFSFVYM